MCFSEKFKLNVFQMCRLICEAGNWHKPKIFLLWRKSSRALLSKHCNFYLCSILTFYIFKLIKHAAHPQQVRIIKPRSKMTFLDFVDLCHYSYKLIRIKCKRQMFWGPPPQKWDFAGYVKCIRSLNSKQFRSGTGYRLKSRQLDGFGKLC